jgi:serine/threonine-protein kinase
VSTAAPPPTLGGRYRVLAELARGGMGVVYLVEHMATGKRHAAKVMLAKYSGDASWSERFLREMRAPARIDSEHVAEVTDAGVAAEVGGLPFLVMELLEGRDLAALLSERGHLSPVEVTSLLGQLARVLDRAHAIGIVHRDLKPTNLFLHRTRDGRTILKVLDFGLATALGEATDLPPLTSTGAIMGTPHYMAPEQARGDRAAIGGHSDRWAVGMITFELLSGQRYWGEANSVAVVGELLAGSIALPSELVPGLGPGFDAWFARSCHVDRAQRFSSAAEQLAALSGALGVATPAGSDLPPTLAIAAADPLPPGVAPAAPVAAPHAAGPHAAGPPHGAPLPLAPAMANPQPIAPPMLAPQPLARPMLGPPHMAPPPTGAPIVRASAPPDRSAAIWLFALVVLVAVGAFGMGLWLRGRTPDASAGAPVEGESDEDAPRPSKKKKKAPRVDGSPKSAPKTPTVRTGRVLLLANPGYAASVRKSVEAHMPEVQACYVEELARDPALEGDLEMMVSLDSKGQAEQPVMCVQRPELVFPEGLCHCIAQRLSSWRFEPPPSDDASGFFYRFLLTRE